MSLDLEKLSAQVAAMTPDLKYHHDLGWLSGVDHGNLGEIYTVASLLLDSTRSGICFNARANGTGLAALRNAAPTLLRLARLGAAYLDWVATYDAQQPPDAAADELAAAYQAAKEV